MYQLKLKKKLKLKNFKPEGNFPSLVTSLTGPFHKAYLYLLVSYIQSSALVKYFRKVKNSAEDFGLRWGFDLFLAVIGEIASDIRDLKYGSCHSGIRRPGQEVTSSGMILNTRMFQDK